MRVSIRVFLPGVMLAVAAACTPTGNSGSPGGGSGGPVASQAGGLPPAPGQTSAERQARRDYYRGPRGDEF